MKTQVDYQSTGLPVKQRQQTWHTTDEMDDCPETPLEQHLLFDPKFWIGDTAATVHMSPQETGLVNMKNPKEAIKVGNGKLIVAKKNGDILGEK
jgi:hypothetical protein